MNFASSDILNLDPASTIWTGQGGGGGSRRQHELNEFAFKLSLSQSVSPLGRIHCYQFVTAYRVCEVSPPPPVRLLIEFATDTL